MALDGGTWPARASSFPPVSLQAAPSHVDRLGLGYVVVEAAVHVWTVREARRPGLRIPKSAAHVCPALQGTPAPEISDDTGSEAIGRSLCDASSPSESRPWAPAKEGQGSRGDIQTYMLYTYSHMPGHGPKGRRRRIPFSPPVSAGASSSRQDSTLSTQPHRVTTRSQETVDSSARCRSPSAIDAAAARPATRHGRDKACPRLSRPGPDLVATIAAANRLLRQPPPPTFYYRPGDEACEAVRRGRRGYSIKCHQPFSAGGGRGSREEGGGGSANPRSKLGGFLASIWHRLIGQPAPSIGRVPRSRRRQSTGLAVPGAVARERALLPPAPPFPCFDFASRASCSGHA
ncbi:hypothetical protein CDD83_1388 [Cordyceps sp. RAO-2017]|nr:hypothetical protein CDD83_1388 [Cordyceps sp. RAO-2017]